MATNFPSGIQTFTDPSGTNLLTSPDHAGMHTVENDTIVALQNNLGTNSGTSILKNFTSGNFAARQNQESFGSPTITGGTFVGQIKNNGTIANGVYGTALYQGGTANGMVLGTPTIGTITIPGTVNALSFSAAIAPGVGTITDTVGTLVVNAQQGNVFYSVQGTSAGNRTIGTPLNSTPYQQLTFAFKASGSTNGTLVWSSVFRMSQDIGTPAIGTGTSWNYYNWRYNAIDSLYDFMGMSTNLV